jgi:hypothetical protein
MENPIPTGYMDLEDCVKSWGEKGRSIYDGLIRKRFTNNDIHPPLDGNSFQSEVSPTPFLVNVKLI